MKHIERFFATVERRPVDRPAAWLGLPTNEAMPGLRSYFKAGDIAGVKKIIDDDMWPVEVPYHCPPANHIAGAFDFAKKTAPATRGARLRRRVFLRTLMIRRK